MFVSLLQFFSPLVVSKILIECGPTGRPNGEADVYFSSHQEAMSAMSRDRQRIGETDGDMETPGSGLHMWLNSPFLYFLGERYIELFLNSVPYSDRR